jgi:hypothetical protein
MGFSSWELDEVSEVGPASEAEHPWSVASRLSARDMEAYISTLGGLHLHLHTSETNYLKRNRDGVQCHLTAESQDNGPIHIRISTSRNMNTETNASRLTPPQLFLLALVIPLFLSGLLLSLNPSESETKAMTAVAGALAISTIMIACVLDNKLYTMLSDTTKMTAERGGCELSMEDTLDDQLRAMYTLSSYPSMRTTWPLVLYFSIFGGIILTCIAEWKFTMKNLCITILGIFFSVLAIQSFINSHCLLQQQIQLDNAYCKLRSILASNRQDLAYTS